MDRAKPMSPRSISTTSQAVSPTTIKNGRHLSLTSFPRELHLDVLTFLRATDLSALQRTCRCFNSRDLIAAVVNHAANVVYPNELTKGFDTPIVSGEVRSVAVASIKNNKKNAALFNKESNNSEDKSEKVYTYEMLRNMEMLVVARVLSRPEPPARERDTCFYVSKSWCRAALRWLEVQEEERKEKEERHRVAEEARAAASAAALCTSPKGGGKGKKHHKRALHPGSSGKKKPSRKEQRQRDRRISDAMPPWSNVNDDIACEHGDLKRCSSKSARARRRVMDKQAWKVLKRLYPDSTQLEANVGRGECLLCAAEAETARKAESDRKEEEKVERRKPLSCPLVRAFYTRGGKGYPTNCLAAPHQPPVYPNEVVLPGKCYLVNTDFAQLDRDNPCPLVPGVYCALPRSWCHRWRKYIKSGEGGPPHAPDASEVLCDAHNLPLVPPHLEAFLRGEAPTLLSSNSGSYAVNNANTNDRPLSSPVAMAHPTSSALTSASADTLQALRAAGLSEVEMHAQRVAMIGLENDLRRSSAGAVNETARINEVGTNASVEHRSETQLTSAAQNRAIANEQLDRENRVVVEILTDEEISALEKWWPRVQCTYALRFAVVSTPQHGNEEAARPDILWSTAPCRECDATGRSTANFVVRNRFQKRSTK